MLSYLFKTDVKAVLSGPQFSTALKNSIVSCFDPECIRIVKEIDKTAFVYISNTNEVLGLGFKENK